MCSCCRQFCLVFWTHWPFNSACALDLSPVDTGLLLWVFVVSGLQEGIPSSPALKEAPWKQLLLLLNGSIREEHIVLICLERAVFLKVFDSERMPFCILHKGTVWTRCDRPCIDDFERYLHAYWITCAIKKCNIWFTDSEKDRAFNLHVKELFVCGGGC